MKLATKQREFHTNKVQEHISYRIGNSAHMSEILSGLYKDPLSACIRELSTNAYDSHVDAGCGDKPFSVTVPTHNDTVFRIRDYGTGLSKEKMRDVYTVYGRSDKTHSNDFDGCLGLGSKSPFCYTDSFTTISYYNGTKYIAINAINDRGRPTFNIMHEEPTTEPNGLEISFDIKSDDINRFVNKAALIYRWFKVEPSTNSSLTSEIKTKKTNLYTHSVFKNDNWVLKTHYEQSYVVMGNVAYPLEKIHFDEKIRGVISLGVTINVDRGEVDFAPSRDSLKYTVHTINNISKHLSKIVDFVKLKIEDDIKSCKFKWDARVKYNELVNGSLQSVYNIIKPDVKFNGEDIKALSSLYKSDDVDICSFMRFKKEIRNNTIRQKEDQSISIHENTKFVVSDTNNKGYAALRRYVTIYPSGSYYIFKNEDNLTDKDGIKYITETLGVNPNDILKTSDFPKVVVSSNGTRTKVFNRSKEILDCQVLKTPSWGYCNKGFWNTDSVNMDIGTYYYVVLEKDYTIVSDKKSYSGNSILDMCKLSGKTNFNNVIGLTKLRYEKIKNKPNWLKFEDFLKQQLDCWHSIEYNIKGVEIHKNRNYFSNYKSLLDYKYLDKNTEMGKFLLSFKDTPDPKDIRDINSLIHKYETYTGKDYIRLKSKNTFNTDTLDKQYPMLSIMDDDTLSDKYYRTPKEEDIKIVSMYINSIG